MDLLDDQRPAPHFNDQRWLGLSQDIGRAMHERGCHPSQCVVLVPYAQLMATARQAWVELARHQASAALYLPRFESTQNWAQALWASRGGFVPAADDLRQDAAFDLITAGQWLARAGLHAQRQALAPALMEAAGSLARVAAAVPPAERAAWGERLRPQLTAGWSTAVLQTEATLAQLALAWASSSRYLTDVLFEADVGLLVVLQGFQRDPLVEALCQRLGERALTLPLTGPAPVRGRAWLQPAADSQEEAERATACVIDLLSRGVQPVGLVAQDRVLTRRVRALLAGQGVVMRDETGWTLSTTRAAASLMSLLRALRRDAACDAVLDGLKHAPAIEAQALLQAEAELRRLGLSRWSDIGPALVHAHAVAQRLRPWQEAMQASRPLAQWLGDLRQLLHDAGLWPMLASDVAGQAVLDALHLHEDAQAPFERLRERWSPQVFVHWISQTLESASFSPVHPPQAQVLILPLSQLLGRSLQALVLPGADETHLPACPEPAGPWTAAQRALLGLPSRAELMQASRAAWDHALQLPQIHILWRQSERGESVMPGPWVQALQLEGQGQHGADLRVPRSLARKPVTQAQASGTQLPVEQLSHAAYADLRSCPYRFFALRQLGLQPAEELEAELGKRDFGNWLHDTLDRFHRLLQASPTQDALMRQRMLDQAAEQARLKLALGADEFLPFQSAWPLVRTGYLQWLAAHEAAGGTYAESEVRKQRPLERWTLVGKIDRVDRDAQGQPLLLDYKTESLDKTRARLKQGAEDTQLAFYAALLGDQALGAAYVNLGEDGEVVTVTQPEVSSLRKLLLEGMRSDLGRLHAGEPLRALGDGQACTHCQARGLCRKDFVAEELEP